MDYGIAETGIARGSPPGTTTEVLRFGFPFEEIRVVSLLEQAKKELYPGCKNATKVSFIVDLFQINCMYGLSKWRWRPYLSSLERFSLKGIVLLTP
jgi:hypothetical protein